MIQYGLPERLASAPSTTIRTSSRGLMLIVLLTFSSTIEFIAPTPQISTILKNNPLIMDGNYLSIGPDDLKSVIVGCQASDDTITSIRMMVKEYAPNVAVRRAARAPNRYRLVIEG